MSYLSEEITFENYKSIILSEQENKQDEIKTAAKIMILFIDIAIYLFSKEQDYETIEFSEKGKLFRIKTKENDTVFNSNHHIEEEILERISNDYFSLIESFIFAKHQDIFQNNENITRINIEKLRDNFSKILVEDEVNIYVDKELSEEYKKDINLWNNDSFGEEIHSVIFSLLQVNNYKKEKILHFNVADSCFSNNHKFLYLESENKILSSEKSLNTHNSNILKNINLLIQKGSMEIDDFIKSSDFLEDKNIVKLNDIEVNNISFSSSTQLQNQVKLFSIYKEKEKISLSVADSVTSEKKLKRI